MNIYLEKMRRIVRIGITYICMLIAYMLIIPTLPNMMP